MRENINSTKVKTWDPICYRYEIFARMSRDSFETWRLGKEKRVLARDGYSGRFLSSGGSVKENSSDRHECIWASQKLRSRFETSPWQGDMYCSYGY